MNQKQQLLYVPQLDFEVNAEDFERVDIYKLNRTDQVVGKPSKYIVDIFKRFVKNRWAVVFFIIFLLIILMSIFVPIASTNAGISAYNPMVESSLAYNLPARVFGSFPTVTKYDATEADIANYKSMGIYIDSVPIVGTNTLYKVIISPYSADILKDIYPILGTDGRGVDIWTKLWTAMGISLGLAFSVSIAAILIGVVYGSIAGSFAGKAPDTLMMRLVEILSGVPTLVWLLILGTVLSGGGETGTVASFSNTTVTISLIFILWFSPAISTRTYILKNKDVEYVQATRTLGGSQTRIIFLHMIPVILGRIAVIFVNLIPTVIFYESSLVFLNLKPTSDLGLGVMLNEAWTASNISLIISPIVVFACLTISAQIVANALNDAIDPRVVGRK